MPPRIIKFTTKQLGRLVSLGRIRLRRTSRWMANGFTRQEAMKLTALKTTNKWTGKTTTRHIPVTRPYAEAMMHNRLAMLRQAQRDGLTASQYKQQVYQYYQDKGWLTPDGKIDYWAEIRHYEQLYGESDKGSRPPYDPTKPHKKLTDDGLIDKTHIAAQRKRYKAKQDSQQRPAPSGKREDWIKELRNQATIADTSSRRRQLEEQIRRLGGKV